MRMRGLFIALAVVLVFASDVRLQGLAQARTAKLAIPISKGWRFRQADQTAWYSANVPGCVHTDLLNNKLIDDPFYRDNEKKLQWIGKSDWVYQTTFVVAPDLLKHDRIEVVFEGLDTYANVSLNEQPLLETDNM